MSLAEHPSSSTLTDGAFRWPGQDLFERFARSPRITLPGGRGKHMVIHTDRVRAKPALSPSLSMNIGITAIGLGLWGTLFPRHVKRTLGITAPTAAVRGLFGARELWSGFTLAGDPTRSDVLWARVAGDMFDILFLRSLDNPANPKRRTARTALGFVMVVTALDIITAAKMTNVKRTSD